MKTTLDIPSDLYRQVKAQAALENRKVKDLVAQGLRLVLSGSGGTKPQTPMDVLEEIRRHPLHPPGEVSKIMEEMRSLRKKGWSRGDLWP
ncbi:MAG TPA: hypothetical protein VIS71_11025 [Terrimicrobium sp.]